MRKIFIAIVAVIVLILVVLLVLPFFIDINSHRGEIQAQLQQRLHRPVQLGAMSLRFPLRVAVQNVTIGEDPRFRTSVPFAQVGEMDVSVKLLPLLAKSVEISSLTLNRPTIELIKDPAGVWNFASIGQASVTPAAASAPGQAPAAAPPPSGGGFSLGELKIKDGQVAVTDLQKHLPRAVYDHIDLTLNDFAPGKPFSLDLEAHLPGKGNETLSVSGKAGPIDQ